MHIVPTNVPQSSLLVRYVDGDNFVDCYTTRVDESVTLERFVRAFYTTRLFKAERFVLSWIAAKPSSDADVVRLARADTDSFAAWRVEAREANELLLRDFLGNTRSWLKCEQDAAGTRLFFGSAVVARSLDAQGRPVLGWRFRALLGFHRRYSVALLNAAVKQLARMR